MSDLEVRLGSGAMFDNIAHRYDLMNRIASLGGDTRWRRRLVDSLRLPPGARVLDLATGTGDVAALLLARGAQVVGLDPSSRMLEIANEKLGAIASAGHRLVEGDAESLPFADESFDAVTMAFGIRNVPRRPRALEEMFRVSKPGARLGILELSMPPGRWIGPFARFYVRRIVPLLGGLIVSPREYRYLESSIAAFPSPGEFTKAIRDAGFRSEATTPMSFGACVLYSGVRP